MHLTAMRPIAAIALAFSLAAAGAAVAEPLSSPTYSIATHAMTSGRALAQSPSYRASLTVAGPVAPGVASSGTTRLEAGYQSLLPRAFVARTPDDFSADDKPDVLWSNVSSGATYVWYMDGPVLDS